MERGFPQALIGILLLLSPLFAAGCLVGGPVARTFNSPQGTRLVPQVPFYPDDTNLCGPASLAALLTFQGYPTTMDEVAAGVQRWALRGAIGPDLVIFARKRGAKASFFSSSPEDLLVFLDKGQPVLVEVDNGIGPIVKAHFMLVVGYTQDGVVANNGLVQQEVIPWSKFLTSWFRMGYFAVLVEGPDKPLPDDPV
ncbi:MAG: C39 family peptidase [Deltaproteobacteria bacterium]|jgi:hypothetical protein|nr:C39 family peptidase [Deltaproteobacteria bacterium]